MGLDMYLNKRVYVGADFEHRGVRGEINLTEGGEAARPIKVNVKKVSEIIERAGYWRKANAIHKWFVDNVQDGDDNCKEHYVTHEQLKTLRELCAKILESKDATELPPTEGFFFGSTEIDEYYFDDLRDTIKIIDEALEDEDGDFYYRSSW